MCHGAVWLMHRKLDTKASTLVDITYAHQRELQEIGLATTPYTQQKGKEGYKYDDVSRVQFGAGRLLGREQRNDGWQTDEATQAIAELREINAAFVEFILPIHRIIFRQINGRDLRPSSEFMINSVQLYGTPDNPMSMHRHYDDTAHTILLKELEGLRVLIKGVWYLLEPRPEGASLLITGNQSINSIGHAVGPWPQKIGVRKNMASFYGSGGLPLLWSVFMNALYKRGGLRKVKGFF